MTVRFWDLSFHTEDNWGIYLQLLQKIQTLTDAPEGKKHTAGREHFLYLKIRVYLT